MNKKNLTGCELEQGDQIPGPTDQTHAESERIPLSKEKEVPQEYPSDTPGTVISEPPSKEYTKDEKIKTDLYGLSKPTRKIIKGKIFYDRD